MFDLQEVQAIAGMAFVGGVFLTITFVIRLLVASAEEEK